jgi:transcriptional regulator with XRE-family HTH domain
MQVSTVHFSGRRMRKARLRKDWSQADLARATGLPEGSLGRWERGEHEPQGAAVVLIARATGRDIEFFYVEGAADDDEEAAAEYRRGLRIGRKQRAAASCPYCGRLCSGSACAEHIDLIRAERAQVR